MECAHRVLNLSWAPIWSFPEFHPTIQLTLGLEFSPLKIKKLDQEESITDLSYSAAIEVEPLWTPINHCSNFCEFISGEEHDLKFSGRFFLKSDSMHEIDDDILHRLN